MPADVSDGGKGNYNVGTPGKFKTKEGKLNKLRETRETLVSVVMPNHNNARYIDQAIAGVVGQSWRNLELIIIDDGSTDQSSAVIKRWLDRDVRIRLFAHQNNRGVATALNTGLTHINGDYVGFCASDDRWLPDKLTLQLDCFARHREVAVVHSDSEIIDERSRRTGELFSGVYHTTKKRLTGDLLRDLLVTNYISAPTVLIRRECVEQVGLFPDSLKWLEDWVYMVRIARHFLFHYLPEVVVQYRIHSGSSNLDKTGYEESRVQARLLMLSEMPEMSRLMRSHIYRQIGVSYMRLGEYRRGRNWFTRATLTAPDVFRNGAYWVLSSMPVEVLRRLLWKAAKSHLGI